MSVVDLLLKVSPALEAGRSLEKPEVWANTASATNALIAVFGFLLLGTRSVGYDIPLSDTQIVELSGTIASVGGTINGYLHTATNPNAGFKNKRLGE